MSDDAGKAISSRFSPQLTPWLAFGWTAAISFVWLFRYEAFLIPVQLVRFASATASSLRLGPNFGHFWLQRMADAGNLAGLLFLGFWIGALIVGRITRERSLLVALIAVTIGLWLLAVGVLLLGIFSVAYIRLVLLVGMCLFFRSPRSFFRCGNGVRFDGWSKFLLGLIVAAALLNLLGAISPSFEYDELEYHLGAPAEYIKAGRIIALPHNFYSNLPQLTEMLYLLAMKITSDVAAKLLHWSFGVLAVLAVYAVAARLWSRRVAMTAAALFYCLPFMQDLSQTARIDLATTFFATLAFGAMLLAGEDNQWLWLSALVGGCAVATKWTAVAVVTLPLVASVLIRRRALKPVLVFGLLSSVPVIPWLIKNWYCTGNPMYPLLNGVFPSPFWSKAQAALFTAKHAPQFDAEGLTQFFERAWQYSFNEPGAMPVFLMTAPLLLLLRDTGPTVRRVLWLFVGAYFGWYLFTFRPWRFLFPALPLAAIVGAVALDAVSNWSRLVVGAVMLVGLAEMGLNVLVDVENPRQAPVQISFVTLVLGQESREEFVTRLGHGTFEPIVWMNHHLPESAKVLYIGEARTYYAQHSVVWSTAYDQHLLDTIDRPPVTADELWMRLRAAGITHVYVNFSEWRRLRQNYNYLLNIENSALRTMLQERAHEIHDAPVGRVWELNP